MSSWIIMESSYKNSRLRVLDPMPPGPYFICSQFEERAFQDMDMSKVISEYNNQLTDKLPFHGCPGVVGFFFNTYSKLEKCFEYYDSSD